MDETGLIRRKKENTGKKGGILRTHKKMMRSLLTTDGKITYSRYVLRPADPDSKEKLLDMDGVSTVIPLDCALHVNGLPLKMTVSMMLEAAFYATVLNSYQAEHDGIGVKPIPSKYHLKISTPGTSNR